MTRNSLLLPILASFLAITAGSAVGQTQLDRLQKERDAVEVLQQQLEAQTLRERIAASQASQARSEAELKRATLGPVLPVQALLPALPPPVVTSPLPSAGATAPPRPVTAPARPSADRGPADVQLVGTMGVDGRFNATFRVAGVTVADLPAGSVLPDGTMIDQVGDGTATIRQRGKSYTLRAVPTPAAPNVPAAFALPPPINVPGLATNMVPVQ